jgi:hypothetical protein
LVGSRAEGTTHELSDWDFVIETSDFETLRRDLPRITAPLEPAAQQWDRYSSTECYMLVLPGPVKVDFIFTEQVREWSPPWVVKAETLEAIDCHFWDWILWLAQKRAGGHQDQMAAGLKDMHRLMLAPMGVKRVPRSLDEAVQSFLKARDELECRLAVQVPRRLQAVVVPALSSLFHSY